MSLRKNLVAKVTWNTYFYYFNEEFERAGGGCGPAEEREHYCPIYGPQESD
jgi:hypothetical protein